MKNKQRLEKIEEKLTITHRDDDYIVIQIVDMDGTIEILNDEVIKLPGDGSQSHKISYDEYLKIEKENK